MTCKNITKIKYLGKVRSDNNMLHNYQCSSCKKIGILSCYEDELETEKQLKRIHES